MVPDPRTTSRILAALAVAAAVLASVVLLTPGPSPTRSSRGSCS
ncbi:hypothetical protein [Halolamina pelagica]|nr:hypothetical protein [Halolamina pelagica]